MKTVITIILCLFLTSVYGQKENFQTLLDSAKAEFHKDYDVQDFDKAAKYLEKAIKLNPKNAEARYFLGYAYSYINSKDGNSIIDISLPLLIKTSEQFEFINKLSPKYSGEIISLDPYSKISSEWGALALKYLYFNELDSAKWALTEGKKRGGFSDFILEINRKVLDYCSLNAILISSGDNFTFPLLYLQIIENYRPDVSFVDISLLNTQWYPEYLYKNKIVSFDLPDEVIDTIQYCNWLDTVISINNFSWTLKPSYYDFYILRGDRIFLSLLKDNNFKRNVFFTTAFGEDQQLSLTNYLIPMIVVDKINSTNKEVQNFYDFKTKTNEILELTKYANKYSSDDLFFVGVIKYNILIKVDELVYSDQKDKAKIILDILDKNITDKKFPDMDKNLNNYENNLKNEL